MKKPKQQIAGVTLWDNVPIRNGKLVGMLTDKLASQALPNNSGDVVKPNDAGFKVINDLGVQKVYKKLPSKFK